MALGFVPFGTGEWFRERWLGGAGVVGYRGHSAAGDLFRDYVGSLIAS